LIAAAARLGSSVTAIPGDISDVTSLDKIIGRMKEEVGELDVLVATAGVTSIVKPFDVTPEYFDYTFGVNAKGTFFTVQKASSLMNEGGSVILFSSGMHSRGIPNYIVYAATKAAIRSMTRSWASELAPRGIRVNCISPGAIETPILRGQFDSELEYEKAMDTFAATAPLGRVGDAREIGDAVYFLASAQSSYMTAADLVIDGGRNNI
jgi:NAD(P)-dependent dehydrogenase (short-subunit alcohol dehydrogenase family)